MEPATGTNVPGTLVAGSYAFRRRLASWCERPIRSTERSAPGWPTDLSISLPRLESVRPGTHGFSMSKTKPGEECVPFFICGSSA